MTAQEHFYTCSRRKPWRLVLRTESNGHVLVAHDAVGIVLEAVDQTDFADTEQARPFRTDVLGKLRGMTAENTWAGASGTVSFQRKRDR